MIKEEKEKRRIQGKSSNTNEHLWFYLFYKKLYFAQKHSSKSKRSSKKVTSSLQHHISFTFLCAEGYLKRSKANIHKYNNYYLIEIYINRLSLTM